MRASEKRRERWSRSMVLLIVGLSALAALGAGIGLGSAMTKNAAASYPDTATAESLTEGTTSYSFPAGYYYWFYVPCTSADNCTSNEYAHNGFWTFTFESANSSTLVLLSFFGNSTATGPGTSSPHLTTTTSTTPKTVEWAGFFAMLHNPHSYTVVGSFSYSVIWEDHGN